MFVIHNILDFYFLIIFFRFFFFFEYFFFNFVLFVFENLVLNIILNVFLFVFFFYILALLSLHSILYIIYRQQLKTESQTITNNTSDDYGSNKLRGVLSNGMNMCLIAGIIILFVL